MLKMLMGSPVMMGLLIGLVIQGQILLRLHENENPESEQLEKVKRSGNLILASAVFLWVYALVSMLFAYQTPLLLCGLSFFATWGLILVTLVGRETIIAMNKEQTEIRKLAIVDLILFVTLIIISFSWRNPALSAVTAYLGVGVTLFCAAKVFIVLWRYKPQLRAEKQIRLGLFLGYLYLILGLILIYSW